MKLIAAICLAFQLVNCEFSSRQAAKDFVDWKTKFNKTYNNATESQNAFNTFKLTTKKIEQHNKMFKLGTTTFRQSPNKFADMPPDQLKSIFSGLRPLPNQMTGRSVSVISAGSLKPAPGPINWRAKGFVTPVKDQGYYCDCCWAFSAISALEVYYCMKYGLNVSFSEQQLIDCNANNDTGNFGCRGGSQGAAFSYMTFAGMQSVETYPYEEDLRHDWVYPCRSNSSLSLLTIKGYYRIRPRDEETMKRFVYWIGPLVIAFNGSLQSYMYYQDGIYDDPTCSSGLSHSALVCGFGETKNSNGTIIPYWLVKNSWGDEWGENGFFRIVRNKNMCGLTNYLIAPILW